MEQFQRLGLSQNVLHAIEQLGYETPTEIQAQAIPHLLGGERDFIGLAQTGTGKTAAFGLPLLERLDPSKRHVQALVLAPTRELGQQIAQQIELFAKYDEGIQTTAVYGGANIATQISQLRKPCQVVIATPGRLIDLAKRKAIALDQIECVVLDEADEMLNMGFKEELDTILAMTPDSKRTWLFSATMPKEIRRLVKHYMTDPIEVRIDPKTAVNDQIEHRYALVRNVDKAEALTRFMDLNQELFAVVFCRTKRETQELAEGLMKKGYRADALHGDLSQPQRDRVMKRFKLKHLQVLIATDVAARGIDVQDVTHVFHFNLPNDNAYYTHRSGRTARAGKKGVSIAFISRREKAIISRMAGALSIDFTPISIPDSKAIASARLDHWAQVVIEREENEGLPMDLWFAMKEWFEGVSKDALLNRLVSLELSKLHVTRGKDLNWTEDDSGRTSNYKTGRSAGRSGGRTPGRAYGRPTEKRQRQTRSENDKQNRPSKKKFNQRTPFTPQDDGDLRYSRRTRSDGRSSAQPKVREEAPFAKFKKKKKGDK
ncbi:MAG: ATP-dependent RNA helicase [Flavobacteriales bacterium]|nr:ATP-dependent RNA helicase [Flavobacteriales bacterium]